MQNFAKLKDLFAAESSQTTYWNRFDLVDSLASAST